MADISAELKQAKAGVLEEIIRQAEIYLQTQLAASIAADQRAIGFTSLLAAATVAIATAGGVLLLSEKPNTVLGAICLFVAAGLLASMFFAIKAAMPAQFWFAGNTPAQWLEDVKTGADLKTAQAQQASHYAEMISDNAQLMTRNNLQMALAVWIAWGTLVVGGTAGVLHITGAS